MEEQIKAILKQREAAIKTMDAEFACKLYTDNVRTFDLVEPLEHCGCEDVKQRLLQWFASFKHINDYFTANISITASDTVAFCSAMNHVSATLKNGKPLSMWWRETLGFEKQGDKWLINHAHTSVPFEMNKMTALTALKPGKIQR